MEEGYLYQRASCTQTNEPVSDRTPVYVKAEQQQKQANNP
jgi:hypothetical protein